MKQGGRASRALFPAANLVALSLVAVISLRTGPVEITYGEMLEALTGHGAFTGDATVSGPRGAEIELARTVLWNIRLPRTLMAVLVGASLALAGCGMQGLFRNPLADPSLIGISAGAAAGAVTVIVLGDSRIGFLWRGLGAFSVPVAAFLGGIAASALVYSLSRYGGRTRVAAMLLTGIAVNAIAAAAIGLMIFLSDAEELREFTFWSLGSLAGATWKSLGLLLPFTLIPMAFFPSFARVLNAFLLGEAEAYHLGIDTQVAQRKLILLSATMVGATVAVCGIIGFVGLIIPHLVRLATGPDHRFTLPSSALLGALILLLADLISRTAAAPSELPIGIITALLGGPFFLGLLYFSKDRVWA